MKSAAVYILRIEGCLDEGWSDWFDGVTIQPDLCGETSITGLVRDQAELIGLINRINDLGLVLISIVRQESD